jgi:hypothetical protein
MSREARRRHRSSSPPPPARSKLETLPRGRGRASSDPSGCSAACVIHSGGATVALMQRRRISFPVRIPRPICRGRRCPGSRCRSLRCTQNDSTNRSSADPRCRSRSARNTRIRRFLRAGRRSAFVRRKSPFASPRPNGRKVARQDISLSNRKESRSWWARRSGASPPTIAMVQYRADCRGKSHRARTTWFLCSPRLFCTPRAADCRPPTRSIPRPRRSRTPRRRGASIRNRTDPLDPSSSTTPGTPPRPSRRAAPLGLQETSRSTARPSRNDPVEIERRARGKRKVRPGPRGGRRSRRGLASGGVTSNRRSGSKRARLSRPLTMMETSFRSTAGSARPWSEETSSRRRSEQAPPTTRRAGQGWSCRSSRAF